MKENRGINQLDSLIWFGNKYRFKTSRFACFKVMNGQNMPFSSFFKNQIKKILFQLLSGNNIFFFS